MRFKIYSAVWMGVILTIVGWTFTVQCSDGLFIGLCGLGRLVLSAAAILLSLGYGIGMLATRGMDKQLLRWFLCLIISVGLIATLGGLIGTVMMVGQQIARLIPVK